MNTPTFRTRISDVEDELSRLASTLAALKITDTTSYAQNYEELSIDAALRAERIACSLRNLIYAVNSVPKTTLMRQTASLQGIAIRHTPDMVEIRLPGLLPKRTRYRNTTYLTDPLHNALQEYSDTHTLPRFQECVVCFTHIFDRSLSAGRVRDYDNLECKQILDTAAAFLLTDDSGLYCDAYHTTDFSDCDYTLLTIIRREALPGWLCGRADRLKTISDF